MRELPILFSTPMVQAIQAGNKNQTRRTAGLEKVNILPDAVFIYGTQRTVNSTDIKFAFKPLIDIMNLGYIIAKPRYQKGDHIWVKETYCFDLLGRLVYRAKDGDKDAGGKSFTWKPSLFMRKEYARIWIECTGVRCERLQDISKFDVVDEGVVYHLNFKSYECPVCGSGGHKGSHLLCEDGFFDKPKDAYQSLWHSINGVESWKSNPLVFVYDFKVINK